MQEKNRPFVKKVLLDLASHAGVKGIRGLAGYLGVPDSSLYSWISRNSIGDLSIILKKIPNARIEWLETGEGEMFTGAEQGESRVTEKAPAYEKPFPEPIQKAIEVLEKNPERAWELYALILERVDKKK